MQYFKGYAPLVFDLEQYKPQNAQKKATTEHVNFLFILYVW